MAASPEFYKPSSSTPTFSPLRSTPVVLSVAVPLPVPVPDDDDCCYRTPTGSGGISYLREPTTCPPAPRKAPPPPCKKRLFPFPSQQQQEDGDVPLIISLRLDQLRTIFRPHHHHPQQQQQTDKRRRSARHQQAIVNPLLQA